MDSPESSAPVIHSAVILAAGRGSRLDDRASSYTKPLVCLGGQTLLERTLDCCRLAGAKRIVVVTGFRAERVTEELERYDRGDIQTLYNEAWERSNGLSVYACRNALPDDFLLMMADHLFDPSILADLARLTLRPNSAVLAVDRKVTEVFDLDDATKVQTEGHRVIAIGKQLSRYDAIDCGLFACTPGVFPALEQSMVDGDCSLSDGMRVLAQRGDFQAFDVGDRRWQDVDTPEMLEQAEALLRHWARPRR